MENTMIQASLPWSDGSGPNSGDQYSELPAGIVFQAVKDYVKVIRSLWNKDLTLEKKRKLITEKLELEEFFYSDWFDYLSDINPDKLMQNCRMRAVEKEKEEIRKRNKRRIKQLQKAAESEENHNETGQDINGSND